ncbi:MAG: dihydrodipicolinate reductase, N-terminus domain protein [Clostridia bacterium]|jgi:4-hydroxy-tetrahydrodipicolinate reductase|nr:dihydrodipicolinate reductase, N-terminus domain protein [Clostridia bacterium]
MNNFKVAQYGTGKMSAYTMKYAIEKGYKIVAAFDVNEDIIGKDIGEVIGCDWLGVKVSNVKDAEKILKETKPDICIITTMSLMKDVYESFKICASLGINAISTCEEAFYPMNSSPKITKELDKIAKENNCTLTGTGYQDVFWCNLISVIAGSTHKITKIKGGSSYNVEDYGIALAKAHGAGLDLTTFEKEVAIVDKISVTERNELIQKGEFLPSYMWNATYALASKLGLEVVSQIQKTVPHIFREDIKSETLCMDIPAGNATGMTAIVVTKTKEGIEIEAECTGKVYPKDEYDRNEWTIYGEPDTTVTINKPATVELTCATIVNRINDVINAEPGFITIDKMDYAKYIV